MDAVLPPPSAKRRAKFVVGGIVMLLALSALVGWAMGRPDATAFYMTVSELRAAGSMEPGRSYRVNGVVVPGSVERDGLETTFAIAEGGARMTVATRAPLPDAFKNGSEVVARGSFDGRLFSADEVLAKCPSKFKAA
jgi:cytochrome c-type biogenesis protein CcmE